jgi:hypothetical protein
VADRRPGGARPSGAVLILALLVWLTGGPRRKGIPEPLRGWGFFLFALLMTALAASGLHLLLPWRFPWVAGAVRQAIAVHALLGLALFGLTGAGRELATDIWHRLTTR